MIPQMIFCVQFFLLCFSKDRDKLDKSSGERGKKYLKNKPGYHLFYLLKKVNAPNRNGGVCY